jgi:hypothetical protein
VGAGNSKLGTGNWKLETGNWRLGTGDWLRYTRRSVLPELQCDPMRQPPGRPIDSRVSGEVEAPMNGVSVLESAAKRPVAVPVAAPTSRLVRLAREVARFVHDLLTETP